MTQTHTSRYILLLGGNLGDVEQTFATARDELSHICDIVSVSGIYCSSAWGFESDDTFRNHIIDLSSNLSPFEMLDRTQSLERLLGRTEKSSNGVYHSRLIDIDILFCDDIVIDSERLTLPHPMLYKRRFTLVPLMEKWRNLVHPILNKTIEQLLEECHDKGDVWQSSPVSN